MRGRDRAACLDPNLTPVRSGAGVEFRALRETKPGLCGKRLASFHEGPIKDENLHAARGGRHRHARGWLRALRENDFTGIVEQLLDLNARPSIRFHEWPGRRLETNLVLVGRIKLPELDEDHAARFGPRGMFRSAWVADVAPLRKVAVLVLKHAGEYEKLLAAIVYMRREAAVRRIAYNRGSLPHLAADPVQHPPAYPADRLLPPTHQRRFPFP